MLIKNEKHFNEMLKKSKKDYFTFLEIVRILKDGNRNLNIKPNYKKAYKLLKYWSGKKDIDKTLVYLYLEDVTKLLGKTEESKYYKNLYYESELVKGEKPVGRYYFALNYIEYKLNEAFDAKNRLVNKKSFDIAMKYLIMYLDTVNSSFTISNDLKNKLFEIFSSDEFGYKNNYYAHYFNSKALYEKANSLKEFSEEEFINYSKFLHRVRSTVNTDFIEYIDKYYRYKYVGDNKSLYDYAKYLISKNYYESYNPQLALEIYEKCYKNGYVKACLDIIKIYDTNCEYKKITALLKKHIKKYNDEKDINLLIADYLYKTYIYNNMIISNLDELITISVSIYLDNINNLNDIQLQNLSNAYFYGLGVDKDLVLANKYSKEEKMKENIKNQKNQDIKAKIILQDDRFKEEIDRYYNGLLVEDAKLIYYLGYELIIGHKVKKSLEVVLELADILASLESPYKDVLYAYYYFENNNDLYKNYLIVALKNKIVEAYELKIKTLSDDEIDECLNEACELGSLYAKYEFIRKNMNNYDVNILNLINDLIENKYYNAYILLGDYYLDINLNNALDAYLMAVSYTNNPLAHYKLYLLGSNNNFNIIKKDKASKHLILAAELGYIKAYSLISNLYIDKQIKIKEKDFKNYLKLGADALDFDCLINYANCLFFELYSFKNDDDLVYELLMKAQKIDPISSLPFSANFYYYESKYQDYDKAYKCALKAYENRLYGSIDVLGLIEIYVHNNVNEGIKYLEIGAKYKVKTCNEHLGNLYYFNEVLPIDYEKALSYYEKELKINERLYVVLMIAECCRCLNRFDKCIVYLKKYENKFNDPEILIKLGYSYCQEHEYEKGLECFLKCANKYQADVAYLNIGVYYYSGNAAKKDENEALKYFLEAFKHGNYIATEYIGRIYNKRGQYDEALKYFELFKKADEDLAIGYIAEILMYKNKYKEAFEMLMKVKENNYITYQCLGDIYYNGYYQFKDYNKAFEYYYKGYILDEKNYNLQFKLGRCYYFGHGTNVDKIKAKELIYLAKNENYSLAVDFYNEFFN